MIKPTWERYCGLWAELKGKKLLVFYAIHYTAVFAILWPFIFRPFLVGDYSFVWKPDGLQQVFARLLYLSHNFHQATASLFSHGVWLYPLYDPRFGLYAADLSIGLPYFPALFWPENAIESLYTIIVICGYYFTGMAFSAMGFYFRRRPDAILAGAISYTFCGFALFTGVRHPHFMPPMILLPLMIIGVEKVMKKEDAWILLISVFLSLTAHFGVYFSCMQAIFIFIYVIIRFFTTVKENRWSEFVRLWGRLCIWGGTGVLLACFVALPSLELLRGNGRVGKNVASFRNMFRYSRLTYEKFIAGFVVEPNHLNDWIFLGFSVYSFPAVLWLFAKHNKQYSVLRILFITLTFMLWIPAVGYVMSGFSSISNRFCFSYALCVCAIIMFMYPKPGELCGKDVLLLAVATAMYIAFVFISFRASRKYVIPGILLLIQVVLVTACYFLRQRSGRIFPLATLGLICISVCASGYLRFGPSRSGYVSEFSQAPNEDVGAGQYASLAASEVVVKDESFFRVSGNGITSTELNYAAVYGLNGLTMYPFYGWSGPYVDLIREMEIPRETARHRLKGLDSRADLLTLAGGKYFAYRINGNGTEPYSFREVDRITRGAIKDVILLNENSLPLGYTYNSYILREEYDKLPAAGKQQAMLQGVVLEREPTLKTVEESSPEITAEQIPVIISAADGASWDGGVLTVEKSNATITLSFAGKPETETYLRIVELVIPDQAKTQYWTVTASTGKSYAHGGFSADSYTYSSAQHTQMLNLGYSERGFDSVTVTFPKTGTFSLKGMEIWCVPMEQLSQQADKLREEALQNVEFSRCGMTADISVKRDKVLCISIPWLEGWKAYLDGEEVQLLHANTAFMGIEIPAGKHVVELKYTLPGLRPGITLSVVGLFLSLVLTRKKREKNKA